MEIERLLGLILVSLISGITILLFTPRRKISIMSAVIVSVILLSVNLILHSILN